MENWKISSATIAGKEKKKKKKKKENKATQIKVPYDGIGTWKLKRARRNRSNENTCTTKYVKKYENVGIGWHRYRKQETKNKYE